VKTAFRALSKIYHPDKNPDGAETFVKLTEGKSLNINIQIKTKNIYIHFIAYETLSDAEERRHYDAHGKRKSTVSGSQQRQQQHHPGERGFSFFTFAEKHWGHQARFRQESKAKDTARFEAIKEAQGERQKAKLEKAEKKSHRWERWSKTFVN